METIYPKRISNAGKKIIYGIIISISTYTIGGLTIILNGYRNSIEGVAYACLGASVFALLLQMSAAMDMIKCNSEPKKFF
jgi:hypothetical protein